RIGGPAPSGRLRRGGARAAPVGPGQGGRRPGRAGLRLGGRVLRRPATGDPGQRGPAHPAAADGPGRLPVGGRLPVPAGGSAAGGHLARQRRRRPARRGGGPRAVGGRNPAAGPPVLVAGRPLLLRGPAPGGTRRAARDHRRGPRDDRRTRPLGTADLTWPWIRCAYWRPARTGRASSVRCPASCTSGAPTSSGPTSTPPTTVRSTCAWSSPCRPGTGSTWSRRTGWRWPTRTG